MVVKRMDRIDGAYVAESASVTGDVILGPDSNVWFGAVLRGDDAPIRIGARTNIQDLTVVHGDPGVTNRIAEDVTVGHRALLHGAAVGPRCLIGMGSILLAGSVVGEECIVGAGALITEGKHIPARSLVLGVPGHVVREVTDEEVAWILESVAGYCTKAADHAGGRYR